MPEEINRKLVDQLGDINLTYSGLARENLLKEGRDPDTVICIRPMTEVLKYYRDDIERSTVLNKFELQPLQYFLVSFRKKKMFLKKRNSKNSLI